MKKMLFFCARISCTDYSRMCPGVFQNVPTTNCTTQYCSFKCLPHGPVVRPCSCLGQPPQTLCNLNTFAQGALPPGPGPPPHTHWGCDPASFLTLERGYIAPLHGQYCPAATPQTQRTLSAMHACTYCCASVTAATSNMPCANRAASAASRV
jgi:hypothetical protein